MKRGDQINAERLSGQVFASDWADIAEPNLKHSSKDPMECYYTLDNLDLGKCKDGAMKGSGRWVEAFVEKSTPEEADIRSLNYPIRGQRDPGTHILHLDT